MEQLPGPYWAPYLVAFLVFLALLTADLWRLGRPLSLEIVYANSLPFYGFWLIHYLNRRAATSLRIFRPVFTGSEAEFQQIHWRLTTLPARPAAFVALVSLVLAMASSLGWSWGHLYEVLGNLAYYATVAFAGLYAYHAIRQLRQVTSLYAGQARVDLHNVAPLYSFSTLSAQTAIGMLLVLSGAALITPAGLVGPWLAGSLIFGSLALMTFLLPLTGLHRHLVEVKDAELTEISRRWQACTAELFARVDRGDWDSDDRLNETLNALERSRTAVERIPTWPWRPETLRGVVVTLVLPVVIWLCQYGLQRWLS